MAAVKRLKDNPPQGECSKLLVNLFPAVIKFLQNIQYIPGLEPGSFLFLTLTTKRFKWQAS